MAGEHHLGGRSDALAVDLLTPAERGRVNGFMYGSSYLGTSIAGAGLGLLMTRYGLAPALAVQVVAILLIMLVPLLVRERPTDVREQPDEGTGGAERGHGARSGVPRRGTR